MISFKRFVIEGESEKKAAKMAHNLLNSMYIDQVDHIPEQISSGARHHGHKFVDTVDGAWVVTLYKNGEHEFVKVDPPKVFFKKTMYFIPRDTGGVESNVTEGAVKNAMIDMIERAIKGCTKKDLDPNYELALTQIAQELRKIDKHNLTDGMTNKQLRDHIRPMYDETDHKDSK